jgi:hypothetical protein
MTQTIPLQWKISTRTLLTAIPGVSAVYLDRYLPVGPNELTAGPVITMREEKSTPATPGRTPAQSDGIFVTTHKVEMEISLHFNIAVLDQISLESDPFMNAVHGVMTGAVAQLPNVGGIQWAGKTPAAEGDAALVRMFYDCYLTTSARDFTLPI